MTDDRKIALDERDMTELALIAEQLLLGCTCDNCRWRRRTDGAEKGRLVLVADACFRGSRAVRKARTCREWQTEALRF